MAKQVNCTFTLFLPNPIQKQITEEKKICETGEREKGKGVKIH